MIAKIYPVKRMPRRFGAFDYDIPDGMNISRGDLVRVPFRNSTILGVVKTLQEKRPRGFEIKPIKERVADISLTDKEIEFFENLSFDLAQAVPSILHAALPSPPKREATPSLVESPKKLTLPNREVKSVSHIVRECQRRRRAFVSVSDLRRMTAIIAGYASKQPDEPLMVIAPNTRDARLVADHLAHLSPVLLTSDETNNMQFAGWRAFRNGNNRVMIGTRLASLHTHPNIGAYFLLKSSHRNHRQWDRNPRYDSRIVAWQLHEKMHAKLFFMDVESRADDMAHFNLTNRLELFRKQVPDIVPMNKERPTAPHPALGSRTVTAIEQALQNDKMVLCGYNKKGKSGRLRCEDCGHVFDCEDCQGPFVVYEKTLRCHRCGHRRAMPADCPNCTGKDLRPRGFGNESIQQALQELFPAAEVVLCDKEHPNTEVLSTSDIIIATTYYLENEFNPFDPPNAGVVAQLDVDTPLYEPTFRAKEQAIINFERWRGVAHACNATFVAQTDQRELFQEFLEQPETVWKEELEMRTAYHQPPARRWFRIHYRDEEQRKSEVAIHKVLKTIKNDFPEAIVYGPKQAKRPGLEIEVGIKAENVHEMLTICKDLKDAYIIDTHAFF
jgi:primosomal protein N'